MPDIVLGFPATSLRPNYSRVSLKANWSDEWQINNDVHAMSATWSAAPNVPQAQLHYRYGWGTRFGTGKVENLLYFDDSILRRFVKIQDIRRLENGGESSIRQWIGTIEAVSDHLGGDARTAPNTGYQGVQVFKCYGLEHQWRRELILHSVFDDPVAGEKKSGRGLVFNKLQNRTKNKVQGRYLFEGDEQRYLKFSDNTEWWSTRDIVEYLLKEHLPRDYQDFVHLEPVVADDELDKLPTDDRPVIETHGRTLYDLLNQLIPRFRLMGWSLDMIADTVYFRVFRMHPDEIDLPGAGSTLPGNANKVTIDVQSDPTCEASLSNMTIDDVDQVVCQGARRRSVFSISVDDMTMIAGWTENQANDYQAGGSSEPGFPAAAEVAAQERKAFSIRGGDDLRDVFARFQLIRKDNVPDADYWTFESGDGIGGDKHIVFRDDEDPDKAFIQFRPGMQLASRLALLDGVKYDGSNVENEEVKTAPLPFVESAIFVLVPDPTDATKYRFIDKQGATNAEATAWNEDRRWSGTVSVDDDGRAIRIGTNQKPRHIIAGTDFSPRDFDDVKPAADWRKFIATIAIEEDRYCEARWPADSKLPTDIQQLRRMRIDVGDAFRFDYLVAGTVVGIDADGTLLHSDGGKINDDRDTLKDIARLAFEWYSARKQVLHLRTSQDSEYLKVGAMITDFKFGAASGGGVEPVDTVITQIDKVWPMTETDDPSQVSEPGESILTVQTDYAQMDPLRL